MVLFLFILFSLTFEEEKLIKFLEPLMLQTEGEIKLEKKVSGENFTVYYAIKEGETKESKDMLPCCIYEGKSVIFGTYFALKGEQKATPQILGAFLSNVFGSTIKVEEWEAIGKNLKSYKAFQETGYGKVQMKVYVLSDRYLFVGNIENIKEKMDDIISNKIDWQRGGKIGNVEAKDKIAFFLDLECPHCAKVEKEVFQYIKGREDLFIGFFLFPLSIHILSFKGSAGAFCFKKKGDELFLDFINWFYEERADIDLDNIDLKIYNFSKEKGIDKDFLDCYMKPENIKEVLKSLQMGLDLNVQATPTIFYNGKKYPPKKIIEMLKNEK